jgi:hypothetical protein
MAKFHINDSGETGTCKATIKECKFGSNGESTGTGVDGHYSSREEANAAAETFMENKYRAVYKGFRSGDRSGMDLPSNMKKRLIKDAAAGTASISASDIGRVLSKDKDEQIRKTVAETLKSQKLLRDMSDDESARVRKAVAMNSKNRTVLDKLAKDPDSAVRLAAIKNVNTPVKARKAAQAAIKEANMRNLSQSRAKAAPVAAPAATATPASATTAETDSKVKNVLRSDRGSLYDPETVKAVRKSIADAHGVSIGKVKLHDATLQVGVAKADGVHVYGSDGEKIGVVEQPIYEKMVNVQSQIERRRVAAKRAGRYFSGLRQSSTIYPAFTNAHDPGFDTLKKDDGSFTETTKVGISRDAPDGFENTTIQVKATSGKVYAYNSMNLRLLSVTDDYYRTR